MSNAVNHPEPTPAERELAAKIYADLRVMCDGLQEANAWLSAAIKAARQSPAHVDAPPSRGVPVEVVSKLAEWLKLRRDTLVGESRGYCLDFAPLGELPAEEMIFDEVEQDEFIAAVEAARDGDQPPQVRADGGTPESEPVKVCDAAHALVERRPGRSKLVYNKTTRTIVAVKSDRYTSFESKVSAALGGSSGASCPSEAHAALPEAGNGLPSTPPIVDRNMELESIRNETETTQSEGTPAASIRGTESQLEKPQGERDSRQEQFDEWVETWIAKRPFNLQINCTTDVERILVATVVRAFARYVRDHQDQWPAVLKDRYEEAVETLYGVKRELAQARAELAAKDSEAERLNDAGRSACQMLLDIHGLIKDRMKDKAPGGSVLDVVRAFCEWTDRTKQHADEAFAELAAVREQREQLGNKLAKLHPASAVRKAVEEFYGLKDCATPPVDAPPAGPASGEGE